MQYGIVIPFTSAIITLITLSCAKNMLSQPSISRQIFSFSQNTKISYEVHGEEDRSILCLHGFGASLETWRDIQASLAREGRLYLIDLKGFGLSSKPNDGRYSLEDQAEIVSTFIESQNLRDVTLVGHSYGGAVSIFTYLKSISARKVNPVSKIILIDAAGYIQDLPFFVDILRTPIINWITMNLVPSKVRARITLNRLFYDTTKVTDERVSRYAKYFDQPGTSYSFIEAARQLIPKNPESIIEEIKNIKVPTLIVWGKNDPAISVDYAYKFKEDISNSRVVIIPDCGHIPNEERPDETVEAIVDFLRS